MFRQAILRRTGASSSELWARTTGEWLAGEHLVRAAGCQDADRIYIHADKDQRTLETGRAFAESLLPGCAHRESMRSPRASRIRCFPAPGRRIRNDARGGARTAGPRSRKSLWPITARRSTTLQAILRGKAEETGCHGRRTQG